MSDFQSEINRLVSGFVSQITELARRAAIDTLGSALDGGGARRGRPPGSGALRVVSGGGGRRKGSKRSSAELDKLSGRLHDYVTKNPGLRIEQINKDLGTTTRDLALPIRKLIADGHIHAKGAKRATTYHTGEGAGTRKRKKS
jgi:hypothetical protein